MALIEQLENRDWRERLRMFFESTLEILKTDPYRSVGSSVDDLRAWLRQGGVNRVKEHLKRQMEIRQFSEEKTKAIQDFLETLLRENRSSLLELIDQKVVPSDTQQLLSECGLSEMNIGDLWKRLMAGERPFEDWMHAHGYSNASIAEIYKVIDDWLMAQNLISTPEEKIN